MLYYTLESSLDFLKNENNEWNKNEFIIITFLIFENIMEFLKHLVREILPS